MKNRKAVLTLCVFLFTGSLSLSIAAERTVLELTIEKINALALERNFDIQIARYDASIKRNDMYTAVSLFDSILNANVGYTLDKLQRASALLGGVSRTTEYGIGVSKKFPTGTTLGVGVDQSRSWSDSAFATTNPAHDSRVSVSLKQEVGRNFFGLQDRSQIRLAELDIENAQYTSLEKIENQLAAIQKAYWKVVLQREKADTRRQMLEQAEELLAIYRDKIKIGMAERTDLYAAEANREIRKRELLTSENQLRSAVNLVLLKLNFDIREDISVVTRDGFSTEQTEYEDFLIHLARAVANRRDYKKALNDVASRDLSVVVKKNSLWPEIDLEASLIRNGVARKYSQALENVGDADHPRYFFGLTVSLPLENTKARGEFKSAQLEKAKALILLKQKERQIVVEVNDAVDAVNTALEKVRGSGVITALQEKKLQEEQKRFRLGRSNSDTLIRFQNDLLQAKMDLADALYDYFAFRIDLEVAQHALLNAEWESVL